MDKLILLGSCSEAEVSRSLFLMLGAVCPPLGEDDSSNDFIFI